MSGLDLNIEEEKADVAAFYMHSSPTNKLSYMLSAVTLSPDEGFVSFCRSDEMILDTAVPVTAIHTHSAAFALYALSLGLLSSSRLPLFWNMVGCVCGHTGVGPCSTRLWVKVLTLK